MSAPAPAVSRHRPVAPRKADHARKSFLRAWLTPAVLGLGLLLLGGCETVGYYTHLAGGQLALLRDRQPVDAVLKDLNGATDEASAMLAGRLRLSRQVLGYADQHLGLQAGGRYRSYVALDRDAVVWNVFAAPPLSLNAHTWCYPFVGCAPYRGYFSRERALEQQDRLRDQGLETYVGAVAAYSTLGWFDDPLLSTFMEMTEADFVELLLHELAHSRVWVRDDVTFNESFASFVGRRGARDFYLKQNRLSDFEDHLSEDVAWQRALVVLGDTRTALKRVYESAAPEAGRMQAKAEVLQVASACLTAMAAATGREGYRRLIPRLNNAYLASLGTYSDRQAAFAVLFSDTGEDWPVFFDRVDELAGLTEMERAERLAALEARAAGSGQQQIAAAGDDDGADQIECEALSGHRFDAELAGTEHDHIRGGGHG